jgi:hypothetical protein
LDYRIYKLSGGPKVKDKKIFKKWWFWVIVVIVLGGIGSLGQSGNKSDTTNNDKSSQQSTSETTDGTLPKLTPDDYKGKEGLVVYKDLKAKGYKVDATFENQALTDINGKASDLFEPLDPNKPDDKLSVDAFKVGNMVQNGDSVILTIVK